LLPACSGRRRRVEHGQLAFARRRCEIDLDVFSIGFGGECASWNAIKTTECLRFSSRLTELDLDWYLTRA
jgi:hypothetical protein